MRIGIIGSSRCTNISIQEWQKKKQDIMALVKANSPNNEPIWLVSGGSSWSDHLAVELYSECDEIHGLVLYLPAKMEGDKYELTHPGKELNKRHGEFSKSLYGSESASLEALGNLYKKFVNNVTGAKEDNKKCQIVVRPGFLQRNTPIANSSDILIAVTVDSSVTGGTLDTWKKFGNTRPKFQLIWEQGQCQSQS